MSVYYIKQLRSVLACMPHRTPPPLRIHQPPYPHPISHSYLHPLAITISATLCCTPLIITLTLTTAIAPLVVLLAMRLLPVIIEAALARVVVSGFLLDGFTSGLVGAEV